MTQLGRYKIIWLLEGYREFQQLQKVGHTNNIPQQWRNTKTFLKKTSEKLKQAARVVIIFCDFCCRFKAPHAKPIFIFLPPMT